MLRRSDIHRCVAQDGVEPGSFARIEIADNGRGMAEEVADLPVILMSGYDGKAALTRFADPGRLRFLQKPLDRAALDTALAEVLEE